MQNKNFKLSKNKINFLFIYFSILLICSIIIVILGLNNSVLLDAYNISTISIVASIGTALMGSTLYYIRKLYKSSIKGILTEPTEEERIKETGLFVYYLLRPVFAIVFSLLFHLFLKASVSIVAVQEIKLDVSMIYLTMFTSFFLGFASGDVITNLEKQSKNIVKNSLK